MNELEFATSQELVKELARRDTFAGIILYSLEEQKEYDQYHDVFSLITKATPEDTVDILKNAIKAIKQEMK